MNIKKILITGNNGTIGTRLCEKLIQNKYIVIGADFNKNRWNEELNKLTINIDLKNKKDVLEKLPEDIDLVIHLAANARVYDLIVNPSLARDNFEMMFNILEFIRLKNIKRIIFASSREVYEDSDNIKNKNMALLKNCRSPYSFSKIAGESLLGAYKNCYEINFIILRFSNVYGMYDFSDRIIPLFIKNCKENKDLHIFGKEKILDFVYIDDCIDSILKCIEKFDEIKNTTLDIAYGEGSSILEIAQYIKKLLETNNSIQIKENRIGETAKYIADISKTKRIINYNPKVNIAAGIKKSIEWYNKFY